MPAGTIALTNNSTAVNGSGTNFSSELKANDFLITIVGGVTYTLAVQSVNSATGLTLITAYNGPTTSGVAWTALPNGAMVGIPAQTAADTARAIRGLNLDKANWQQVYSASGNITVTLPDGSQYSGPSWSSLSKSLAGLGNAATRNVGTVAGTVAAGDDSRLNTINGKSGGTISSALTVNKLSADGSNTVGDGLSIVAADPSFNIVMQYYLVTGQYHKFRMVQNGTETLQVRSSGAVYASSFNPTSDSNLKFNKTFIESALMKSMSLRGMTYDLNGDRKAGVIAQDALKVLPESVTRNKDPLVLEDGTILTETLSLDYSAIAGMHTEALKDLMPLMLEMLNDPEAAKTKITELISAINKSTDDVNKTSMKMEWALLNPPIWPSEPEPSGNMQADDVSNEPAE
ncbi:tail fiber domain-containing protein [Pantoea agglomerans]|uniref:tail fiber domain-containing protein n=1 Tax=Enterobacter agglomerans TaxID=549 RepID=UPI001F3483D9|nr:tail fiber domain-containing protein [Pantoea agglomerans]UIL51505.1 tail fiber domain-containing protein [Pantoea agglomerans]